MIRPAIVSPTFDAAWFVGPGVLSLGVALALATSGHAGASLGVVGWVVLVLAIDVAHVWATIWRTYLDPEVRRVQRRRLWILPALVGWFGFLLHLESPAAFWTVLAYVAIFHFIMQHVGFAAIYGRKGGESPRDRKLAKVALVAGTAGPIVWWHANLPRSFAWFIEGDLVAGLPTWIGGGALVVSAAVLLAFAIRRAWLTVRGRGNPMVAALVLVPAANWWIGIVAFDGDAIFTVTNVVMHGVPYLALVWVAGGRRNVEAALGRLRRARTPMVGVTAPLALYAGGLLALALLEEGLWDRLIWHDHGVLFGQPVTLDHPVLTAAVVAALSVPQATHYLLDRWIWRAGPDNPRLAEDLGLA